MVRSLRELDHGGAVDEPATGRFRGGMADRPRRPLVRRRSTPARWTRWPPNAAGCRWSRLDPGYRFTAPDGEEVGLAGLFDGKRQLVVYHFMLRPGQDHLCDGCCSFTDNLADQVHLNARDTRLILLCRAPQAEIEPIRKRMGWTVPWYSVTAALSTTISASPGVSG